ncbi:MAG: hypothetical protein FWD67_11650, partial [Betaproteobacteria bacterium]|nr:hypothetical protein [Betaproteobacteria bacterium]
MSLLDLLKTKNTQKQQLAERWRQAWPQALEAWSKYTRLRDPLLCTNRAEAAKEGLTGTFAKIYLRDQRIVIDLETVAKLGLGDYAVEILAHEIGHHVLAPANATDHFRLLARVRRNLPMLEQHAPVVVVLYLDLLVNDRLQRRCAMRMADIYRHMAASPEAQQGSNAVWDLYMRIYENLWQLEPGSLSSREKGGGANTDIKMDAWLGARLVRVYADDWLAGAGRFATLLVPYLVEDNKNSKAQSPIPYLLDTTDAVAGCDPAGGIDIEPDEVAPHPSEDPAITGMELEEGTQEGSQQQVVYLSQGQAREPFEYGEILRAVGIKLDDHETAARYYRERALPHLVPFPTRPAPESTEPQLEGLEPWEIGDPLDELDVVEGARPRDREHAVGADGPALVVDLVGRQGDVLALQALVRALRAGVGHAGGAYVQRGAGAHQPAAVVGAARAH